MTEDRSDGRVAVADFAGTCRRIHLTFTPEAIVGDYVIAHSGFAVDVVSEHEAAQAMAAIRELEGER